jgi:hypothetical protein
MAETQQPMSSSDAGNVTGSSSKAQRARGVSDVPVVNPKINQDEFASALDDLVGVWKIQEGCSVGRITRELPEPLQTKFKETLRNEKVNSARLVEVLATFGITVGSDVMRRHRRRLLGKDGCKCPNES